MRIIGGHDYYDGGLAHGRDEAILFLRNGDRRMSTAEAHDALRLPRTLLAAHFRTGERTWDSHRWRAYDTENMHHALKDVRVDRIEHRVASASVLLCGTLRHGVRIRASSVGGFVRTVDDRWIWSADALRSYARDHRLDLAEGRTETARPYQGGNGRRTRVDVPVLDADRWFEPIVLEGAARDAVVEARVTIASRDGSEFHANDADGVHRPWLVDQPTLAAMGFAKAVDPYTAFQEISMWLGGVLPANGPPMVEITDDKVKIAKHGFHHPTSFRRAKADA